ncbi:MAG TPA: RES family NAD+ phosphorylase [Thermoanaerobaculia bacterium]|nr:RES family NAD+ phosphorylase [Thermoanaerobaculia bacterium]
MIRRPRPLPGPTHVVARPLPLRTWSDPLYRICRVDRDPIYFGKDARSRFDDPRWEFGVLYAAGTAEGAFVETCIRDERPGSGRCLTQAFLEERRLTRISVPAPLRLVDLTGAGLTWLDADARLPSGAYSVAQRWSRAFWSHPDQPDGVLYRSRFNLSLRCAALFDRNSGGISMEDLGPLLDAQNIGFLGEMLDRYGFALL